MKTFKIPVIIFLALFSMSAFVTADTLTGKVIAIMDGDTIKVLDSKHNQFKIRLAGIDAPEKKQDFGTQAKKALSGKIYNKTVEVRYKDTDRYGRIVGDIYLGDRWVNLEMVQEGLCMDVPKIFL